LNLCPFSLFRISSILNFIINTPYCPTKIPILNGSLKLKNIQIKLLIYNFNRKINETDCQKKKAREVLTKKNIQEKDSFAESHFKTVL